MATETEKSNFEGLRVYQQALKLVEDIYSLTRLLPKDELFGLTSQLKRAALSVPLNIAEGQGRGGPAENKQFLLVARGSLWGRFRTEIFSLIRQINTLVNYLKNRIRS